MLMWILVIGLQTGPVAGHTTPDSSLETARSLVSDSNDEVASGDTGSTSGARAAAQKPGKAKAAKKEQKSQDDVDTRRMVWKQHPSLRIGSAFRLDLKALVQEDGQASQVAPAGLSALELHQTRIGVSGNIYKRLEFEVERELTDTNADPAKPQKTLWKDVYVNVSAIKNAQIQVGRFKIPFGKDELTSTSQTAFVYRSLGARYLAPARDVGGMVHGRFFNHGLGYWAGVFVHDGDHSRSSKMQGADGTLAGRVTGRPFRALGLDAIEVGTAFAVSSLSDDSFEPNGLRGRTVLTQDTFFRSVYVNGQRRRFETDVDWTAGPASARAEVTWVNDGRRQQGLADDDLGDAQARSWYVAGGWKVIGQRKKRHAGVELVGRYERLWFGSASGSIVDELSRSPRAEYIMPSANRALTVGVNWTVNRWVKLQVNGIRERVEDAERSPAPDGAAFWSRVFRLQFSL